MLWSDESLKPDLMRCAALLHEGLISPQQAADGVLAACSFTLLDHSEAWQGVTDALSVLPTPLLSKTASQLAAKQLSSGGWLWPPVGAIGTPGGATAFSPASPAEAAVLEALFRWLRDRVAHRAD